MTFGPQREAGNEKVYVVPIIQLSGFNMFAVSPEGTAMGELVERLGHIAEIAAPFAEAAVLAAAA